jgi:hypothetical protein
MKRFAHCPVCARLLDGSQSTQLRVARGAERHGHFLYMFRPLQANYPDQKSHGRVATWAPLLSRRNLLSAIEVLERRNNLLKLAFVECDGQRPFSFPTSAVFWPSVPPFEEPPIPFRGPKIVLCHIPDKLKYLDRARQLACPGLQFLESE